MDSLLKIVVLAVTALLATSITAGCSGLTVIRQAEAGGDLTVVSPWARSAGAGDNSAAYMEIINSGGGTDRLIGVSSDIAGTVEIHEVVADGQMMRMQQVESIDVPAGESVLLEPGGLHVMFFELIDDLESGDELDLVLAFERAGDIVVTVTVRDQPHGHGGQGVGECTTA